MIFADYLKVKSEYEEQKILEKYQRERILPRPKTHYIHIVIFAFLYLIAVAIDVSLLCILPNTLTVIATTFFIPTFSEFYLRFLGIKIVECYQHYASDFTRRRCLCIPSCSEYAIICLKKYELICALVKIRKRLHITCSGDLYIIDFPYKK